MLNRQAILKEFQISAVCYLAGVRIFTLKGGYPLNLLYYRESSGLTVAFVLWQAAFAITLSMIRTSIISNPRFIGSVSYSWVTSMRYLSVSNDEKYEKLALTFRLFHPL